MKRKEEEKVSGLGRDDDGVVKINWETQRKRKEEKKVTRERHE